MVFAPQHCSQFSATRDLKQSNGAESLSAEMQGLNKSFSRAHAMSIHLNLIAIVATLFYGWQLSSRLDIGTV
jgi:hypothetical protein